MSVTTKCAIVSEGKVIGKALTKTGVDTEKCAEAVFTQAMSEARLKAEDITKVISTGYGRRLFKKADKIITEISAAGYSAYILGGKRRCVVIDVGGQDTKVIEVGEKGEVLDFLMNDKCAAGIFNAISSRIATMLSSFPAKEETLFCGGGAKSEALRTALEKMTGRKIEVLSIPQFVVAFGAAIS